MNTSVDSVARATEPTLRDIFGLLWRTRWGVLAGVIVGALVAVVYLFFTPKVYEAEVVVAPAIQSEAGQLGGILGQLGGVSSLLGVNVPMQGGGQDALAVMRSRELARDFISTEGLEPLMFPEHWDSIQNAWKKDRREPTMAEAVRRFDEKVRFVEEDRRTGMVNVRIQLPSRSKVAPLANRFVASLNERLREKAIRDAESALDYLRAQLVATQEVEVRQAIYRVMESQLTVAALARTRPDFAFRVIDPASEPDVHDHVTPITSKVLAAGIFVGGVIGLIAGLLWPTVMRRRVDCT
jgi:uncharacterized protein involved in exopolysaccharide biosynthesis